MVKKTQRKASTAERAIYRRLAKTAPVKIPEAATVRASHKQAGYEQLVYSWQGQGWRYQARWHSRLPNAKLVTKPSWRIDRVKAGHGFGPGARPRLSQSWSTRRGWVPSSALHRSAWRLGHGRQKPSDARLIKETHSIPDQKK